MSLEHGLIFSYDFARILTGEGGVSPKCGFIVSNTIEIDGIFMGVVINDLHKRQGRYTYFYPTTLAGSITMGMGMISEATSYMFTENINTEEYFNG